jgi:hypothetical protein
VLNTKQRIKINLHDLQENADGAMYCPLQNPKGRARLTPKALEDLADLAETDERGIYIQFGGQRIYLHEEQ